MNEVCDVGVGVGVALVVGVGVALGVGVRLVTGIPGIPTTSSLEAPSIVVLAYTLIK